MCASGVVERAIFVSAFSGCLRTQHLHATTSRQDVFVDSQSLARNALPAVILLYETAGVGAHLGAQRGLIDEALKCASEGFDVARRYQQAGLAFEHKLRRT